MASNPGTCPAAPSTGRQGESKCYSIRAPNFGENHAMITDIADDRVTDRLLRPVEASGLAP